jgi:hypothetical protein
MRRHQDPPNRSREQNRKLDAVDKATAPVSKSNASLGRETAGASLFWSNERNCSDLSDIPASQKCKRGPFCVLQFSVVSSRGAIARSHVTFVARLGG